MHFALCGFAVMHVQRTSATVQASAFLVNTIRNWRRQLACSSLANCQARWWRRGSGPCMRIIMERLLNVLSGQRPRVQKDLEAHVFIALVNCIVYIHYFKATFE